MAATMAALGASWRSFSVPLSSSSAVGGAASGCALMTPNATSSGEKPVDPLMFVERVLGLQVGV